MTINDNTFTTWDAEAEYLCRLARAETTQCFEWWGYRQPDGYGRWSYRDGKRVRNISAHRAAWELAHGPIPEGMEVDHLCNNRGCVNVAHMRLALHRDNTMASHSNSVARMKANQTHCVHGHEFTAENTHVRRNGTRMCRTCARDRQRAKRIIAAFEDLVFRDIPLPAWHPLVTGEF